ncbi:type II secretion system protein [Clostridium sp.]|uniref:type II secretion system protein n=1 Tax=Clostridium sp. TaxID=1506 RepID=UPI003F36A9D9
MTMRNDKKKQKKKAFTMIELIAVMAIIAILAAVLVPNITGYIQEARKVGVVQQARDVIVALESVNIKTNNSLDENSTISDVINKSGGILDQDKINKIDHTVTVATCKEIVDTEKNKITLSSDGKFESVTDINN